MSEQTEIISLEELERLGRCWSVLASIKEITLSNEDKKRAETTRKLVRREIDRIFSGKNATL